MLNHNFRSTGHAFLWKHGVEHGDPSLYNIMCHPETRRGVLTDFDLSILQWEDRVPGCDRTGTVPFMALELLQEEYWSGDIVRYYHHELEAFIWCLPFMCLGGFVTNSERHKVIADWVVASPEECRGRKGNFIKDAPKYLSDIPPNFIACYRLGIMLCYTAEDAYNKFSRLTISKYPSVSGIRNDASAEKFPAAAQSLELWTLFLNALKEVPWTGPVPTAPTVLPILDDAAITSLAVRLEAHRPHFDGLDDKMKSELQELFIANTEPPALQVQVPKLKDRMKGRQDPRPCSTPPIPPPSD